MKPNNGRPEELKIEKIEILEELLLGQMSPSASLSRLSVEGMEPSGQMRFSRTK
jgi:hypothetical protein